jgi:hypothetical protein
MGEEALRALTMHGRLVTEPVFKTLNNDLAGTVSRLKSFYVNFSERYRRGVVTFGEGLRDYL